MPFEIVRNDIVHMQVDAIVNTANPRARIGYGVDSGIHKKAGPKLLEARKAIGDIAVGHAAITPGFDLDADYVIHAVGPLWQNSSCASAMTTLCALLWSTSANPLPFLFSLPAITVSPRRPLCKSPSMRSAVS